MFNTAGVSSIWRIFSALSIVLPGILLGACTNTPTPDPGEPKKWIVENVGSKSTAELYAELIAPAVFERSSSKVIKGYTVESGMLRMPDKTVGSLVTVRSIDGGLTALIDRPGRPGLLSVNNKGSSIFTPSSHIDSNIDDSVPSPSGDVSVSTAVSDELKVVDILIGFSRAAVDAVGGDATAFALAQVESVNMYLRNSRVTNVTVNLVGIQVVDKNWGNNQTSISQLPSIFSIGAAAYEPDLIAAFFVSEPGDGSDGYGNFRGRYSVQAPNGRAVFVHELGHNAGGSPNHCETAGVTYYGQGYDNGKSRTIMCGSWYATTPHFSNPHITDQYGLPLGDFEKADMARVWRENAERLSTYAIFLPKAPTGFRDIPGSPGVINFVWDQSPRAVKYEVWGKDNILLPYKKMGESSSLSVTLVNPPRGVRPYYLVAIYSDGTKSPNSNVINAKPFETQK